VESFLLFFLEKKQRKRILVRNFFYRIFRIRTEKKKIIEE